MNRHLSFQSFFLSQILILVLSLSFIGGFYYLVNQESLSKSAEYSPVTSEPSSFNLEINSEDDLLIFDKTYVVSGKTAPLATVIVSNGSQNVGIEASVKGDFSRVITLTPGLNRVSVAAFDTYGNTKTEVRSIYYSEEKIE